MKSNFVKKNPYEKVSVKNMTGHIFNGINSGASKPQINNSYINNQKQVSTPNVNVVEQQPTLAAAYIAGQSYFNNLRNKIKSYDPECGVDYYDILISDLDEYPNNPEYFKIEISVKDGGEVIGEFGITKGTSSWEEIINYLASQVITIIKRYQSSPLENNHSSNNISSNGILVNESSIKLVGKDLVKKTLSEKNNNNNVIETKSDDNVTYYPVLVDTRETEVNETPELDKAKKEISKKIDEMSEEEVCNKCLEILNNLNNSLLSNDMEPIKNSKFNIPIELIHASINNIELYKDKKFIFGKKQNELFKYFKDLLKCDILNIDIFDKIANFVCY